MTTTTTTKHNLPYVKTFHSAEPGAVTQRKQGSLGYSSTLGPENIREINTGYMPQ